MGRGGRNRPTPGGRRVARGYAAAGRSPNRERRTVNKTVAYLTAIAALGGLVAFGALSHAQNTGTGTAAPATQPAPARPKIALVNIAKVLKEYAKANAQGKE